MLKLSLSFSFIAVGGWQKFHCYEFKNSLKCVVLQNVPLSTEDTAKYQNGYQRLDTLTR